ncbi:hypothetical protein ISKNV_00025 [Infectious spleen and kidney necrosis virus]|nr:hypothetical protein ISKNV_00025 [Infectious spleen and kidney necrosis virus]
MFQDFAAVAAYMYHLAMYNMLCQQAVAVACPNNLHISLSRYPAAEGGRLVVDFQVIEGGGVAICHSQQHKK